MSGDTTQEKRFITMAECQASAKQKAQEIVSIESRSRGAIGWVPDRLTLYGVPRGGRIPAALVGGELRGLGVNNIEYVDDPTDAQYIIDDLIDSGGTLARHAHCDGVFVALFDKRQNAHGEHPADKRWYVFPWEADETTTDNSAEDIFVRLLQFIGEDPKREGLLETPKRVLKAWGEWASGYGQKAEDILKSFKDGGEKADSLVIVHGIPVISKCEHHLADIIGVAHVGYIPDGKIVGLSKLARITNMHARRLQVQERMTANIADDIDRILKPKGVGVLIRASHGCMSTRGVRIHGSETTTSAMRGVLMHEAPARAEFMQLCDMAERGKR